MYKSFIQSTTLVILIVLTQTSFAQNSSDERDYDRRALDVQMSDQNQEILNQAMRAYRDRRYRQTIQILQSLEGRESTNALRYYLLGLCYNRLDMYTEAVQSFRQASQLGSRARDINYEVGQAFYAMNELNRAMNFFRASYQQNYMPAQSLYYLGHISQILDEHRDARDYFTTLINHPESPAALVQIAHFQRAESLLSMARMTERPRDIVRDKVLPQYEIARELDSNSRVGQDIQVRVAEIKREFRLDPNIMINGRQLPLQRWQIDLTQRLTHDSNITFSNDLPTTEASESNSYIFYTEVLANKSFVYNQRFIITPQLRISTTNHADRKNSDIYRNDSYTIRPMIKTRTEHTLFNRPASFILDWENDYIARDRDANKNRKLFSRSNTFTFGERFNFFSFGETTIRFKTRSYRAHDPQLDFDSSSYSLDQVVILPRNHILIGLINLDQIRSEREIASSDTLTLRTDYLIPNIAPQLTLGLNLTYISTDNYNDPSKNSADTTLIPGVSLTRRMGRNWRAKVSHEYLKVSSENPINEFTKHLTTFEVRYIF